MRSNSLMMIVAAAALTCWAGIASAQQAGGGPQPQLGPNTPGGSPPAQTMPPRAMPGTPATTGEGRPTRGNAEGAAKVQNGEAQGNRAQDHER